MHITFRTTYLFFIAMLLVGCSVPEKSEIEKAVLYKSNEWCYLHEQTADMFEGDCDDWSSLEEDAFRSCISEAVQDSTEHSMEAKKVAAAGLFLNPAIAESTWRRLVKEDRSVLYASYERAEKECGYDESLELLEEVY